MPDNVLKKLQDFLKSLDPQEQQDAWAILSCIRGPDDQRSWNAKGNGTNAVRAALYPPMFQLASIHGNEPNYKAIPKRYSDETDDEYSDKIYGRLSRGDRVSQHFADHIVTAFLIMRRLIDNPNTEVPGVGDNQTKQG